MRTLQQTNRHASVSVWLLALLLATLCGVGLYPLGARAQTYGGVFATASNSVACITTSTLAPCATVTFTVPTRFASYAIQCAAGASGLQNSTAGAIFGLFTVAGGSNASGTSINQGCAASGECGQGGSVAFTASGGATVTVKHEISSNAGAATIPIDGDTIVCTGYVY